MTLLEPTCLLVFRSWDSVDLSPLRRTTRRLHKIGRTDDGAELEDAVCSTRLTDDGTPVPTSRPADQRIGRPADQQTSGPADQQTGRPADQRWRCRRRGAALDGSCWVGGGHTSASASSGSAAAPSAGRNRAASRPSSAAGLPGSAPDRPRRQRRLQSTSQHPEPLALCFKLAIRC